MKSLFFILLLIFSFSCASKSPTVQSSKPISKKPSYGKGQNSYYYYLLSQIKAFEGQEGEVHKLLDLALDKDTDSSFLLMQKAYSDARLENIEIAFKEVKKSLRKDPNNVEALLLLAKIYSAKQDVDQAIENYNKVLALDPKNEEAYTLLARDYLTLKKSRPQTEQALRQCLNYLPESFSCLYYLATINMENKQYNEALKYYKIITDLNPEEAKIFEVMGDIYYQRGDYKKALDAYKQIVALNPDNLAAHIRVGILYYHLKEMDLAIEKFLGLYSSYPESDRVNYYLGLLFVEKENLKVAFDYFDHIGSGSVFFSEALNHQLRILRKWQRYHEAVSLIDRRFPSKDMAEYYNLKSSLYLLELDYENAIQVLNQGLRKFQSHESLLFQRAIAFEKLDDWGSAKKDLELLLKINPDHAEALNFLGYSMVVRSDDLPRAIEYIEKALTLKPNQGHILDSLGWAYYKMGQLKESLPYTLRAHRLDPEEPTILEHLGLIYFDMKNKRKARFYFNRSLEILESLSKKRPEDQKQIENIKKKLAEF